MCATLGAVMATDRGAPNEARLPGVSVLLRRPPHRAPQYGCEEKHDVKSYVEEVRISCSVDPAAGQHLGAGRGLEASMSDMTRLGDRKAVLMMLMPNVIPLNVG